MFKAYSEAIFSEQRNFDLVIRGFGITLAIAQIIGIYQNHLGKSKIFIQNLDKFRTVCLVLTELLPVLGLLGTVLALMNTFKAFSAESPDMTKIIKDFAPAMSTTISGLIMVLPNLCLNALIWLLCPITKSKE